MWKIVNYLAAIFWFGMFISLFFGYEPTKITIGTSFFSLGFFILIVELGRKNE